MGKVDHKTLRQGSSLDVTDKLLSYGQAADDYVMTKIDAAGGRLGAPYFGMGTAGWEPPAQPFPATKNSRPVARSAPFWRSE